MCSYNRHAAWGGWWVIFLNKYYVKGTHKNVCEKKMMCKMFYYDALQKVYRNNLRNLNLTNGKMYGMIQLDKFMVRVYKSAQEKLPQNAL